MTSSWCVIPRGDAMSVWDFKFESEEIQFGDVCISAHTIVGNSVTPPLKASTMHSHGFYKLHIVTEGSYEFFSNGETIVLNKGEQILFIPDGEHKTKQITDTAHREHFIFSIRKVDGNKGFYKYFTEGLKNISGKALKLPKSLVCRILDYNNAPLCRNIGRHCFRKLEVGSIIVGILETVAVNEKPYDNNLNLDFDIMLETFVQNSEISIREMSERLGYSERQISRKIKERYGKTLTEIRRSKK